MDLKWLLLVFYAWNLTILPGVWTAEKTAPKGCNMANLIKDSRVCTRGFLDTMINEPSVNCSDAFKNMTSCLHRVLFSKCFEVTNSPLIRPQLETLLKLYVRSITSMEGTYCKAGAASVNVSLSSIPDFIKKVVPCQQEAYEQGPACAHDFVAKFKANRTDPSLCGLYTQTKTCEMKVVRKYCREQMSNVVDPYNPFCAKQAGVKGDAYQLLPTMLPQFIFSFMIVWKIAPW